MLNLTVHCKCDDEHLIFRGQSCHFTANGNRRMRQEDKKGVLLDEDGGGREMKRRTSRNMERENWRNSKSSFRKAAWQ